MPPPIVGTGTPPTTGSATLNVRAATAGTKLLATVHWSRPVTVTYRWFLDGALISGRDDAVPTPSLPRGPRPPAVARRMGRRRRSVGRRRRRLRSTSRLEHPDAQGEQHQGQDREGRRPARCVALGGAAGPADGPGHPAPAGRHALGGAPQRLRADHVGGGVRLLLPRARRSSRLVARTGRLCRRCRPAARDLAVRCVHGSLTDRPGRDDLAANSVISGSAISFRLNQAACVPCGGRFTGWWVAAVGVSIPSLAFPVRRSPGDRRTLATSPPWGGRLQCSRSGRHFARRVSADSSASIAARRRRRSVPATCARWRTRTSTSCPDRRSCAASCGRTRAISGLDGQLFVDEYNSRHFDPRDERRLPAAAAHGPRAPQPQARVAHHPDRDRRHRGPGRAGDRGRELPGQHGEGTAVAGRHVVAGADRRRQLGAHRDDHRGARDDRGGAVRPGHGRGASARAT